MQMVLNEEDLHLLALGIADVLLPMFGHDSQVKEDNALMTVEELASYLKVSCDWVYKQVSSCAIPVTRAGKALRFQKKEIIKWLDGQTMQPVESNPATRKLKEVLRRNEDCDSSVLH